MNRVYRFRLQLTDRQALLIPGPLRTLSVAPARDGSDDLDLWVEVDPGGPTVRREFLIVGTGNPMPADVGAFVGTAQTHGGQLVWHVFEAAA